MISTLSFSLLDKSYPSGKYFAIMMECYLERDERKSCKGFGKRWYALPVEELFYGVRLVETLPVSGIRYLDEVKTHLEYVKLRT